MRHADVLIQIFCRAPEPGRVKTRLVPVLGEAGAVRVYAEMTDRLISELVGAGICAVEIRSSGSSDTFFSRYSIPLYQQEGDDLGSRMAHALQSGLRSFNSVILMGTDCPGINKGYVESAITALTETDVVLGPAEDGGYGLVGVRDTVPDIFSGIEWGTGQVLAQTCRRLNDQQINYALLSPIWDVDQPEDLPRYDEWLAKQR